MMRLTVNVGACAALLAVAACGVRSTASIAPVAGDSEQAIYDSPQTSPASVLITSGDITDRPYRSLGDITVTVSKWTLLDADPTRAQIDKALREKAAAIGADAVVLVRYGTVGIGFTSWGTLEGKGRAIQYAVMAQ